MANPQIENGFTKIANELLEEIIKRDFSKREMKIIFAVIRYTFGFNRKESDLSSRYLEPVTGIDQANISRTIKDLESKKILLIDKSNNHSQLNKISINKNYEQWEADAKTTSVVNMKPMPKQHRTDAKTTSETDAKIASNKRKNKESINKERSFFLELVPNELKTDSFLSLWKEWINYRKELKKPIKETTAKKQLKFLSQQTEPESIIEKSILNGWQGLFPIKDQVTNQPKVIKATI